MCILICVECGVALGASPWCSLEHPCTCTCGGPEQEVGGDSWVCLDCLGATLKEHILEDHPRAPDERTPEPADESIEVV